MKPSSRVLLLPSLLCTLLLCGSATAADAELMPLASTRSLMLDIVDGSQRAVIVGERGHVLVSESRSDWRQIAGVPTLATLTAVAAAGDRLWAVGHDGTILHSADGGLTWAKQREEVWTPAGKDEDPFDRDPRLGVPLLDVLFVDERVGYAIGAYSLLLTTDDGGASWKQVLLNKPDPAGAAEVDDTESADDTSWTFSDEDLMLDEEDDPHLNGIVRTPAGLLFIVAERGAAYRSRDDGQSWERLSLPYEGSMFGVLAFGDQHLLAYGLRGNILESRDGGDSWEAVDSGTTLSLMGGAALPDGGAVIVGANGVVLYRPDADSPFSLDTFENANQETPVLSAVLPQGRRTFLVVGERGLGRYQVN